MTAVPKKTTNQPRYAWLRECILHDIASGKYPVGSLLPPEHDLAEAYQVSRHTVREATRALAESGQISRHPGIGTIVCSASAPRPYVAALGTASELFEYTSATRLEVLASREIVADAKLSAMLGCEVGSRWREIDAFRYAIGQSAPISFSNIYLRPEFADIEKRLRGQHPSIYLMLEKLHGQTIHAVRQGIEATLMPAEPARLLGVRARSAALHLLRAYLDVEGRVLNVSSNLYAAERFKLETYWNHRPDVAAGAAQPRRAGRRVAPSVKTLRRGTRPGQSA